VTAQISIDWNAVRDYGERAEIVRALQAKLDGPSVDEPIQLAPGARLFHADCREALRHLADNSIDSVVTDPPYALVSIVKRFGGANAAPAKGNEAYVRASAGFMGKTWDNGETAFSDAFWSEVLRVLKPGGHCVAFGASRGYHRLACAIEDAGFEIRDSLMWIYGTGFPKSHDVSKGIEAKIKTGRSDSQVTGNGSKSREPGQHFSEFARGDTQKQRFYPTTPEAAQWEGWGTALKPAFEPIVLARKPLSEGTVAANVLRWGTGALNIGACRVPSESRSAKAGGMARKASPVYGSFAGVENVEGEAPQRWPANVVHDGSDEVVGAFPGTNPSRKGKPRGAASGDGWGMTQTGAEYEDSVSAARFFYRAKASKADRNGSKHPTVKPVALMQWLCRLVTPPGGTVLDPFAGSGTTGAAAVAEGFDVVLCEREAEYVQDIRNRFDASDRDDGFTEVRGRRIYGVFGTTDLRSVRGRTIGPIGLKR